MFKSVWMDTIFLTSLIGMWVILCYHTVLIVACYRFFLKGKKRLAENLDGIQDYPLVSILIPAHNEEIVIRNTLDAMLELDYPRHLVEIIVINDQSTDKTGEILDAYAEKFHRVRPLHIPKGEGGKGKSHALNRGLKQAKGEVIAVYDADNSPEPMALRYLVAELASDPRYGVVCGKVRTQNRKKNLLASFINLEFISHQWMVQAGRWHLHKITMIPGTNFVIWRKVLDEIGNWDEKALTEDAEMGLRILELDYLISFNPFAITWEQEPELWRVWFRQRMRWLTGNQYLVRKYLSPKYFSWKTFRVLIYMLGVYAILLWAVILSDLLFIAGLFQLVKLNMAGPLILTWVVAILLFIVGISITLSFEETSENTLRNLGITVLMYFIYSQCWVYLGVRSLLLPFENKKKKPFWVKTPRVRLENA